MATALGFRYLCRFYEGTTTVAMLDYCLSRNMITATEYERALTGEPPIGYVPTPTAMTASTDAAE